MSERDPRSVFEADDDVTARAAAAWLAEHGIDAEVIGDLASGGFGEMTGLVSHARPPVIEVRVKDATVAEEAREQLATWASGIQARRERREALTGDLIVACEECGKQVVFAASQAGNVEECPYCGRYIDVPDPDGESFDVGEAEDDEAEG